MSERQKEQATDGRFDVVVVGGGPAGLNGALVLARSRRSVLVIDSGAPRNAPADAAHGMFARDGLSPTELRELGREEVRRYGGGFLDGEVTGARRDGVGFVVQLEEGRAVIARRLLLTTGLVDGLPEVPGLAEHWGRDVVHCPYCHGYEVRDQPIGVLAVGPPSVHHALLFRQLTNDVVYFPHDTELAAEQREQFAALGIEVVDGRVSAVVSAGGRVVGLTMADGRTVDRTTIAVVTRMDARAGFLDELGLSAEEHPSGMGSHVPADQFGRSAVPGVFLAGNVTDLVAQVGASAAAGATAAQHINADLVSEDAGIALERHRAERIHMAAIR